MRVGRRSRMQSVAALLIAACCGTSVMRAQQITTPASIVNPDASGATAAECQNDASRWFDVAFKAASDSVGQKLIKTIDFAVLNTQNSVQLKRCVMKLDAAGFSGARLLDLARVYAQTRDPEAAAHAVKRYLAEPTTTDSLRAAAMLSMARQFSLRAEDLAHAEPYVDQLDAIANAPVSLKRLAHEGLFSRYQSYDLDLGAQKHALAFIRLAHNAKAQTRSREHPDIPDGGVDASQLMTMYQTAANVDGNFGREANAIKLLEQARRDHPEIPAAAFDSGFHSTISRLQLIGKPASAIAAEHWLSAPDGMRTSSFAGNVTVLGFTAHWCPPCQATYVPLQAMSDSMSGRGVRMMFVTTYYGYVGSKRNLSAEAEREATRLYYQNKHITFPVAMLGDGFEPAKVAQRQMPSAFASYFVEQIPQSVIIDQHGKIRRIIVGWDPANSERLPVLLNSLLRER